MEKLTEHITMWDEDILILDYIDQLKELGVEIPLMNTSKSFVFPMVTYGNKFNLTIITYSSAENNSGYIMLKVEDFLHNEELNLEFLSKITTVKEDELLKVIKTQIDDIADRIDYPYEIKVVMDDNFTGLKSYIK